MRGPYHFDDAITPLGDPASLSVGDWTSHSTTTLRPLTKLSYAIEASLGIDDAPAARRVVSVAMHATAAALLALLLIALVESTLLAGLVAVMWAVHPVHAESVLAIAGRSSVLAGAFVIGALLAAVRRRDVLAAALFAAAVLSRETALAAIVPLVATTRLRRSGGSVLYLAGVAIVAAAWIAWTPRYQQLATYSFDEMRAGDAITAQLAAVPVGLSLYVRPWALSIDHGEPLPDALAIAGVAIYVAAVVLLVVAVRRRALAPAIGVSLWLAAIAPTQSFVPKIDWLTERPLSLALAGIVIALAPWYRRSIVPAVIAVAFATMTLWRGQLYADDAKLWANAVANAPHALRPHWNYAQALIASDRFDEAHEVLLRARELAPYDARIEAALRHVARKRGKL